MDSGKLEGFLERIASSLERIASALESLEPSERLSAVSSAEIKKTAAPAAELLSANAAAVLKSVPSEPSAAEASPEPENASEYAASSKSDSAETIFRRESVSSYVPADYAGRPAPKAAGPSRFGLNSAINLSGDFSSVPLERAPEKVYTEGVREFACTLGAVSGRGAAIARKYPLMTEFLLKRSIVVNEIYHPAVPAELEKSLERIAFFMGRNYAHISLLLTAIKSNLVSKDNFIVNFGMSGREDFIISRTICDALDQISYLEEYKSIDYPECRIQAKTVGIGVVHNFFSGFWFERYVAQEAEKAAAEVTAEFNLPARCFEVMRNAKLSVPNTKVSVPNSVCERDIMVIVADEIYWIECKTGDNYIDSVPAYEEFAADFKFKPENCFLVYLDSQGNSYRYGGSGLHICPSSEFFNEFSKRIRQKAACLQ